jgi:CubicO group peptidase (beta-lactamase class C family)
MKSRTLNPFFFQLALSLQLSVLVAENVHGEDSPAANTNASAGIELGNAAIKTMLRDYIDTDKLGVGLVIGIVDEHGARIVSHGKMDNGTDRDVDGDTVFEIGSITKVFTALLLQDMVERGEMKLDDPVQKYLPDSVKMPAHQGKQITLLHLATHTSGLPGGPNNLSPKSWRDPDQADYTVEQLYSFLSHHTLRRAPGIQEEYSNLGMQLLGHVIALKAGKDYETLVLERICQPLGMDSTRITLTPELQSRLAIGHAIPGRPVHGMEFPFLPGAGGLRSTATDLLKFVSAYSGLTPSPLNSLMEKAKAFHSMESGGKLMLAWGGDNTVFAHNGGTYGYMTVLGFDPKIRRGVVVLSNCRNSRIVDDIWGPLRDERSPKPSHTVPMDAALYDRYVGQYQIDERQNICTVRREGERLMIRWIGRSGEPYISEEVFPQSKSVFRNEFWGVQATFLPAADSQALNLVLTSLSPYSGFKDPIKLTRISTNVPEVPAPVRLDSRIYDGYGGRYRKAFLFGLVHLGPTLSITHETDELGNHLIASVRGVP